MKDKMSGQPSVENSEDKKSKWGSAKFERYRPYVLNFNVLPHKEVSYLNFKTEEEGKHFPPDAIKKISFSDSIQIMFESCQNILSIERQPLGLGVQIKTDGRFHRFVVKPPVGEILYAQAVLLEKKKAVPVSDCSWYYYDSDTFMEDPHDTHDFFLAYKNEVLCDRAILSDVMESPLIMDEIFALEDYPKITVKEKRNELAYGVWIYRKFINESMPGQLLKIREELEEKERG